MRTGRRYRQRIGRFSFESWEAAVSVFNADRGFLLNDGFTT